MKLILSLAAALALAACATTSTTETAQPSAPEKEYRTGSRIPVKDPSASTASPSKTLDPSALGPGVPIRTN